MALDWENIRKNSNGKTTSGIDWDKIRATPKANTNVNPIPKASSVAPTFKTLAEAQKYATDNKLNVVGSNVQIPKLTNINSSISDTIKPAIEQARTDTIKENKFNFYDDVIEPTNNFMKNVTYGAGEILGKPVVKYVGGTVNNVGRLLSGEKPYTLDEMQQITDNAFGGLEKKLNKGDIASYTGKSVGNTLGYLGSAYSLGGRPLSFGTISAIQTAGNTNDAVDIGAQGIKGYAFGTLNKLIGGVTNKLLSKVPGTMTNLGLNIGKNSFSGGIGMYSAGALTGEAENLYNKYLRGRDVSREDWIKPVWSTEALTNAVVGTITGGYNGTKADLAKAKTQATADYNKLGNDLNKTSNQMNNALKSGNLVEAQKQFMQGKQAINNFASTKYLGLKLNQGGIDILNNFWDGVGYANSIQYNPTMLGTGTTALPEGSVLPTQVTPKSTLSLPKYNGPQAGNTVTATPQATLKLPEYSGQIEKDLIDGTSFRKQVNEINISHKSPSYVKANLENMARNNKEIKVVDATGNNQFINDSNVKTNVGNYVKNLPNIVIKENSKVLSNTASSAKEVATKGMNNDKRQALAKLQESVENSTYINSANDSKNRPGVSFDYYASPVKTDNGLKIATINDRKVPGIGDTLYGYEIKNRAMSPITRLEEDSSNTKILHNTTSINNIIPSDKKYVNNSMEKNVKSKSMLPTNEELQQFKNEQTEKVGKDIETLNLGTYKTQMFKNNANAINNTIQAKNNQLSVIEEQINKAKQELKSKKNKGTKSATILANRIIRLEKQKADIEIKYVQNINKLENHNAKINQLKNQISEDKLPTRKEIKQNIIDKTDLETYNLDKANKVPKITMNNTTPERLMEKIFDKETAQKINDNFIYPIKHNEAERIRFLNTERDEIKSFGINNKAESSAVQKYGEGVVVDSKTGAEVPYTLEDLKVEFPNTWEKIKNASEKMKQKYDIYLDDINEQLNANGYDSIPKVKNYFRHFEEINDLFQMVGIYSKADALPTDINGLTADLKPGKNFFANALSRTGKKTSYDAIKGIDGYLEGASKIIYHTSDIQNLRTLHDYIGNKYGKMADVQSLPENEQNNKIQLVQENHLSDFASWLTEYTNNIAGKKAMTDRGNESDFGRRIYSTLNILKKQVGSNLTGFNVNSALSNFISVTQAVPKTNKKAVIQGTLDTIKNVFSKDDFIDKSDFLTTRFGSDKLSKTIWEKASNAGQIFMAGTDYFTANQITRSKYYECINKGYSEKEAMKVADNFARRIMAGRGIGDMPNMFNSKMLGILTQFQLENVNQFDSIIHDTFYEDYSKESDFKLAKEKPKFYNGLCATFILGQLFAFSYVFNKLKKKETGYGGALDPIGIVEQSITDYQTLPLKEATANLTKNIVGQIPYANIITGGGRIPTTDSIPNAYNILTGESKWENEASKLFNLIPPTGGGQLRKTIQGANVLLNEGDYKTNSEGEKQLKFPVDLDNMSNDEKFKTSVQALLFGKYSLPTSQDYISSGFKSLSVPKTEEYEKAKDMGITAKEFYKVRDTVRNLDDEATAIERRNAIRKILNELDMELEQKNYLFKIFK